jgi:hypothetical protein
MVWSWNAFRCAITQIIGGFAAVTNGARAGARAHFSGSGSQGLRAPRGRSPQPWRLLPVTGTWEVRSVERVTLHGDPGLAKRRGISICNFHW